ncbi:hypothetical protein ROTAS13_04747 [Roseomonas sp. TAS13]|nr:hypothetical protein ROTAS13_04747 [Roseomonas sp. TAS13]
MDVAFAAHGRRVAQAPGDPLDGRADVAPAHRLAVEALELPQGQRRHHRSSPGAEVLGRDVPPGDLPQVVVHILGPDGMCLPVLVPVGEEFLPRQILAGPDHPRDPPVPQSELPTLAALALEVEADLAAVQPDMPVPQRGQAIGAVLRGIVLVADTDQRVLQQPRHGRQHLLPRQALARHVRRHPLPDLRQAGSELHHVPVFRRIPRFPPSGVVAVLLAAPLIPARGLEMPVRQRADPDVAIGGRNGQRTDAGEFRLVAQRMPVRIAIGEAAARPVS